MEQERLSRPAYPQATFWALYAAIAMPVIYFGTQVIAAPFYPEYSFARDRASILGTTSSEQPWIFNLGAVLTGAAGLVGAFGHDAPDGAGVCGRNNAAAIYVGGCRTSWGSGYALTRRSK
jgi:hypothetical protein